MWEKILLIVVGIPVAFLVLRGLWKATGVQSGTGCPVCDALHGHDHDHDHDHNHDHGHNHNHGHEHAKPNTDAAK